MTRSSYAALVYEDALSVAKATWPCTYLLLKLLLPVYRVASTIDLCAVSIDLGADPVIVNPWGFNALYMATDTPELLHRLLTYPSVDVNRHCGERQETAIHLAAVIGSVEATETLLRAGASINARTSFNENALWLSIWKRHTEVCSCTD